MVAFNVLVCTPSTPLTIHPNWVSSAIGWPSSPVRGGSKGSERWRWSRPTRMSTSPPVCLRFKSFRWDHCCFNTFQSRTGTGLVKVGIDEQLITTGPFLDSNRRSTRWELYVVVVTPIPSTFNSCFFPLNFKFCTKDSRTKVVSLPLSKKTVAGTTEPSAARTSTWATQKAMLLGSVWAADDFASLTSPGPPVAPEDGSSSWSRISCHNLHPLTEQSFLKKQRLVLCFVP